MSSYLVVRAAGLVIALACSAGAAHAQTASDAALVERGRAVAVAADCAACHTKPGGGAPFAGGYGIESPLGTIFSTNITPSKVAGIGNYTEAQFARVLREGVRADGANLYPAMPYTAYTHMNDADIHGLYAYLTKAVPANDAVAPETKLPFPFNIRLSLAAWNVLFLDKSVLVPDARKSAVWNRGNYLVNALEHCGACHTPRNMLMGEKSAEAFSGAQLGSWFAPNITSDPVSGIGGWTQQELVQYLKTGAVHGKAQAAGGMAEAVENSLQHLSDDDLDAIATYMRGTKPVRDVAQTKPAYEQGAPVDLEPALRGMSVQDSTTPVVGAAALYSGSCASCHQPNGTGTRDGIYPSLLHNTATGAQQASNLISAILFGVDRSVGGKHVLMPRFDGQSRVQALSDAQIADISNYVLTQFGNASLHVIPEDVALTRRGGPPSPLAFLTTAAVPGMIAVAIVVLLLAALVFRRRRKALA